MENKYKVGEELEAKIEKIVPNGFGMAFAENLTVFVPLSVAGDNLRVKIRQLKGKTAFAEIIEIIEPSADRVEPKCAVFGTCGGCNFQQMNYETQLASKIGILHDCLSRIGKINHECEIKIIPSENPFEYRARAQWHIDTSDRKIGYFARNSQKVVDVELCPILTPELNDAMSRIRRDFDWNGKWSGILDVEAASSGGEVSIFSDEIIERTEEIEFELGEFKLLHSSNVFFQGNSLLIEKLVEAALPKEGGETAFDLYCGVGLFSLPLASVFESVTGVESFGRAIDFAERNAKNAGQINIEFYRESVADFLKENEGSITDVDFLLLDPPRSGTEKGTIEAIIDIAPTRISYVSCEPSILARDLSLLTASGYKIDSIVAIDLFPQTHHVETVVHLSRI